MISVESGHLKFFVFSRFRDTDFVIGDWYAALWFSCDRLETDVLLNAAPQFCQLQQRLLCTATAVPPYTAARSKTIWALCCATGMPKTRASSHLGTRAISGEERKQESPDQLRRAQRAPQQAYLMKVGYYFLFRFCRGLLACRTGILNPSSCGCLCYCVLLYGCTPVFDIYATFGH